MTPAIVSAAHYNPYDVMGSGFASDVLTVARMAMQERVEDMMRLFGSAGKAVTDRANLGRSAYGSTTTGFMIRKGVRPSEQTE